MSRDVPALRCTGPCEGPSSLRHERDRDPAGTARALATSGYGPPAVAGTAGFAAWPGARGAARGARPAGRVVTGRYGA